jgi:hypothetical protein
LRYKCEPAVCCLDIISKLHCLPLPTMTTKTSHLLIKISIFLGYYKKELSFTSIKTKRRNVNVCPTGDINENELKITHQNKV